MLEWFLNGVQIERLIWARPLSTIAMAAVSVGVLALTIFLYRRSWGVPL